MKSAKRAIGKLFQSPKTILTNEDLALILSENNRDNLKAKISYYIKTKALIRLTRGVFAKSRDYEARELATSLYSPAYISFETALREAGLIFQHYDTIFVASRRSKTMMVDKQVITFRKLKDPVLYNPAGIANRGSYSLATAERAFLDTLYLFPDYYFDDLGPIDWDKCFDLVKIYGNRQLVYRLTKYQKKYAGS